MRIDGGGRRGWSRLLAGTACAAALSLAVPGMASAAPAAPPVATAQPTTTLSADAVQKARTAWQTHGRPIALVIVRPTSIDLVDQGRLTRRIPRWNASVTLTALSRYLPRNWLSITGNTARLSGAIVVTPGVTLGIGAPVTTLQLAGGATAPEAASVYTGSGALTLQGVTVTSVDRTSGQVMKPGAGRPFIVVSPAGRFTATDATIGDLGSSPTDDANQPDTQGHPGLDFRAGSTGSLVRTSVLRNGTGLQLSGSQGVHLEAVTVSGSAGDGLVLRGDRGTTMTGIRAEQNGAYGVHVIGPSTNRPVTGITATGNGTYGIGVDKQTGLTISGVTTSADESGGVDLSQSSKITISGLTTTNEAAGVFTHVNTTDVVLDHLTSTGGRRGVLIEKTTHRLTIHDSTISGATVAGVAAGGADVTLQDMSVSDSRTGLRIERGAAGITATGLALSGGQDGVVAAPGTTGVVLQDMRVEGVTGDAVRSSSPDAKIVGGRIAGGATGIDVDAATTISGTSIGLVDQGIRTYSPTLVHADDVEVNAVSVGINTAAGSPFLLTRSQVHALEAVRGTVNAEGANDLSLPPLNLLGAIGIPVIVLALALQAVAAFRGRRFGGDKWRTPPALPGATAAAAPAAKAGRPVLPDVPAPAA
jgi:Periplasmic copper-binding protein (NosD)